MSRILVGFDPGFSSVGVAIVREDSNGNFRILHLGVIRTKKKKKTDKSSVSEDNFKRAQYIYKEIENLFATHGLYRQGPDSVFMCPITGKYNKIFAEAMNFPRSSSVAGKMSLCWGLLAGISHEFRISLEQLSPQKIKKLVAGKNTASKEEVEEALRKIFTTANFSGLLSKVPKSLYEHPFDALAAIVAGLQEKENLDISNGLDGSNGKVIE